MRRQHPLQVLPVPSPSARDRRSSFGFGGKTCYKTRVDSGKQCKITSNSTIAEGQPRLVSAGVQTLNEPKNVITKRNRNIAIDISASAVPCRLSTKTS